MKPADLDLNLPVDIPDWAPAPVTAEAWLAEQREVIADYIKRTDEKSRLKQFYRDHQDAKPFVWVD